MIQASQQFCITGEVTPLMPQVLAAAEMEISQMPGVMICSIDPLSPKKGTSVLYLRSTASLFKYFRKTSVI